jgi:hypothetical protein
MRLLSLFGLDARIRRLRIAAAEGALAAEDRVQLLRMAWEDEKQRLKLMLVLVVAVLGLTTVTVACCPWRWWFISGKRLTASRPPGRWLACGSCSGWRPPSACC